ncbi:MAG: PilZ domain-containing protein [Desulfobacterales bacterium]|nr:MAG: PilZ domain-containing protein [Desulfobacterales bacterium]UCG80118.1 MAG: PilZ domain-containing protein [Desulfobacterales bacterium]
MQLASLVEIALTGTNSVEPQTVYVNQDDTAVLVCPNCGTSKTAKVTRFKGHKGPLKIRCKCALTFSVSLEFRRAHRKQTNLTGYYCRLPVCKNWHSMVVKNISQTGIGFATFMSHNLMKGTEVRVKFTLDDVNQSEIEKDVIVRVVKDKYVGCEFRDPALFDKALGFYLMP